MQKIKSSDFQKGLGLTMSVARRAPVTITNHGRDDLVILDAEEFKRLKSLDDRQTYFAWEIDETRLLAFKTAKAPAEAKALNHLMD